MKAEIINSGMQISFDRTDNADLKENPEAVLKAVFDNLSKNNDSLTIQQNDEMKQMMIPVCPLEDMPEVIRKYVTDYNAEIDFISEHRLAKNVVVAVRVETEQKSGMYEYQKKDYSLIYSVQNDNPLIKRLFGSLK